MALRVQTNDEAEPAPIRGTLGISPNRVEHDAGGAAPVSKNALMPQNSAGAGILRELKQEEAGSQRKLSRKTSSGIVDHTKKKKKSCARSPLWQKYLLRPDSTGKIIWDAVAVGLLLYTIIIAPLRLGFSIEDLCPEAIFMFEMLIDIAFVIDLLLNFITASFNDTVHGTELDFNPLHIARDYLKSWFVIDLLSSMPIDLIMSLALNGCPGNAELFVYELNVTEITKAEDSNRAKLLRMVRMLRLMKLAKLLRVLKLQNRVNDLGDRFPQLINLTFFKLIRLLFLTIYIAHLLACGFYWVGASIFYSEDPTERAHSWLSNPSTLDGYSDRHPSLPGLRWEEVYEPYTAAMYWTFTTITTVGYGDISPRHPLERWYAIMCMIIGTLVFGQVIANLGEILETAGGGHRAMQARLNSLHNFMREKKLSYELQVRMRRHFRFYWQRAITLDDAHDELLRQLSAPLRHDVVKAMYRSVISALPLFSLLEDENFWDAMLRAMQPHLISPDETLITQGRLGNEMYLITHGRLEVFYTASNVLVTTKPEPKHVRNIITGGHVGEIALFSAFDLRDGPSGDERRDLRTATVIARAHCELFAIERGPFLQICKDFPTVRDHFISVAKERLAHTDKLDAKVSKVACKFARRLQVARDQTLASESCAGTDTLRSDKLKGAASAAPTSMFATLSLLSEAKREMEEEEEDEATRPPSPERQPTAAASIAGLLNVTNISGGESPVHNPSAAFSGIVNLQQSQQSAATPSAPPNPTLSMVSPMPAGELRGEVHAMRAELAALRHDLQARLPGVGGGGGAVLSSAAAGGAMRGALVASKMASSRGIFALAKKREGDPNGQASPMKTSAPA